MRASSTQAAEENKTLIKGNATVGNVSFHINGFYRDNENVEIPGMARIIREEDHDEDHDEDEEEDHDEDHDEEHGEEEEENIRLDIEQTRYDAALHVDQPFRGADAFRQYAGRMVLGEAGRTEHGHTGCDTPQGAEAAEEFPADLQGPGEIAGMPLGTGQQTGIPVLPCHCASYRPGMAARSPAPPS